MRVMRWLNCFQHIQGMMFQAAAFWPLRRLTHNKRDRAGEAASFYGEHSARVDRCCYITTARGDDAANHP